MIINFSSRISPKEFYLFMVGFLRGNDLTPGCAKESLLVVSGTIYGTGIKPRYKVNTYPTFCDISLQQRQFLILEVVREGGLYLPWTDNLFYYH